MKGKREQVLPWAREQGLVSRELPDEVLVYDLERNKAHCLNRPAAFVWKHCDGRSTVAALARLLEREFQATATDEVVWLALDQLDRLHLLQERVRPPSERGRISRRELVRLGVAAALVPAVASILAPTPAQAATCRPSGAPCTTSAQCCSGICSGGSCA